MGSSDNPRTFKPAGPAPDRPAVTTQAHVAALDALLADWSAATGAPESLLKTARRILSSLEAATATQTALDELAGSWVEAFQSAGLSWRQAMSLFLEAQFRLHRPDARQLAMIQLAVAEAAEGRWREKQTQNLEAIKLTNRKLQEVDKNRADFISSLSHELRTPLTAIAGACELLLDDFAPELSGPQEEYITMISHGAQLIRRLIDDVLDHAKLDAKRLELHPEPLNVVELVRDIEILVAPLLNEKGLRWDRDVSDGLPLIHADAVRIRQVLLNLVSNAIKFTPSGGSVSLRAWLEKRTGRKPPQLAISVSDSGCGISPENQKLVFERFRQVRDREARGTGLGLPIAKRLVELHGGRISLTSAVDQGSTFTFTVPLSPDPC